MDENTTLINITIDENLRTLTIPTNGTVFGVVGDISVNRVMFVLPRYFRGFDLTQCVARVNYCNPNGDANYYEADDLTETEGKATFTWLMAPDVTSYIGDVKFSIQLYKKDETGKIIRNFNTKYSTGKVLEGYNVEQQVTPEQQETLVEKISKEVKDNISESLKTETSEAISAEIEEKKTDALTEMNDKKTSALTEIEKKKTAAVNEVNSEQVVHDVSQLKDDLVDLNELDFSKVLTIKDEYVDQSGVITPYKTWARTDYLPVPKGNILKIKTPNLISMYDSNYNCFYDKDKKFISYFKTVMNKENRIVIPYGAVYYILSGEYKDLMTKIEVQKKITLNVEENSDRILNNGIFVNKSLYTHFTRIGENKYIFREFKRYEVNLILDLYRMYIGHIENNSPVEDEKIGTSSSDVIGPVSICNTLTGTYSWSGGVHGIKIGETTYPTAENVSSKLFCDGKEITRDGFYIGKIRIICENDLYFPQTITGYDRTDATKAIREKRVYTLTDKMNVKVFLSTYTDCYINYYYGCQCLTYDMTDIYLPNNELHTSYSEISNYLLFNKREQKYYCSKDNRHYDVEVHPFGLGSYYLNDGSNPSYKFGNIASFRKIYHQFIANNTKIENNKCLMWEADYDYYID